MPTVFKNAMLSSKTKTYEVSYLNLIVIQTEREILIKIRRPEGKPIIVYYKRGMSISHQFIIQKNYTDNKCPPLNKRPCNKGTVHKFFKTSQ